MAETPATPTHTGTSRVKRGMAEMLKGGVIMDVVTAEQAKIAEDAGAVAVMALERVPADIRAQGGVSRMSDPDMIDSIIETVSIPVMAKARIGHFAEAQVLQSLGVDYIDESEVLTPADYANHIDKWNFTVPFVCGATNLGEALRRITEGAAMIRSKGEAGTGDVSNAVTHMRTIRAELRRLQGLEADELYVAAKELQAPYDLVKEVAEAGKLPVVLFTAGGIATPADAAMMMQLGAEGVFVGSGIFKSGNPAAARRGDRQGHDVLRRPRRGRQGQPRPGRGDGRHQRRRDPAAAPALRARLVTQPIGVLALQGDVREHLAVLDRLGEDAIAVRRPAELAAVRRTDHPRRGVDHDDQAGEDLRAVRAAAGAHPRRAADVRHVRRDDPARRPDRGRRRRAGDARRARHHRAAQRLRPSGRHLRGRPRVRGARRAGARGLHPRALGRGGRARASRCWLASPTDRPPVGSSRFARVR